MTAPRWIRDPLGILADGAERGVVIDEGRIVECIPGGAIPATEGAAVSCNATMRSWRTASG